MSVYEKLMSVQAELKAPKGQYNSFGKYHYRSAEDIVEAAKPLCIEKGLLLTLTDDISEVGGRIYVKSTAAVTDATEGKCVSCTAFAREPDEKKGMDTSQITGSASSYARKYALNGLFAIDDTKDADAIPPDADKPFYCMDCKKQIQGDGKLSAAEIAKRSTAKFARCLCLECSKKAAQT